MRLWHYIYGNLVLQWAGRYVPHMITLARPFIIRVDSWRSLRRVENVGSVVRHQVYCGGLAAAKRSIHYSCREPRVGEYAVHLMLQ